ncbi:hypothetical protein TRFO_02618 [Tritrichomonas foetus]|uniref:Uncharacterized protein n=1 Tax=Tritrichomonas foetus TaxID=1144522 RepID=A0A1J4L395_9EUKA|nr:hypothetical protein TRFO_02618 [Tritrichomonas foetus]|eukprot:OHT17552.1 hypothetical protein TRFO_02618 [Tritrichomonas foetus]
MNHKGSHDNSSKDSSGTRKIKRNSSLTPQKEVKSDNKSQRAVPKKSKQVLQAEKMELFMNQFTSAINIFKKKQLLFALAKVEYKLPEKEESEKNPEPKPAPTKDRTLFLLNYFMDEIKTKKTKSLKNFNTNFQKDHVNKWDKVNMSYFKFPRPPVYSKEAHFTDFICNGNYKISNVGAEGQRSSNTDVDDPSPIPSYYAILQLSMRIDEFCKNIIDYNQKLDQYLDPSKSSSKRVKMMDQGQFLNQLVNDRIKLEKELKDIEDDRTYKYREPMCTDLALIETLTTPTFLFDELQFLYFVLVLIESRAKLSPHHDRPITTCLNHLIPLLLTIGKPSKRDLPCHLVVPPIHVQYLRILFDTLNRLHEYMQDVRFIPFRATFGLDSLTRADLTVDMIPSELKRLFDSIEKGGSMTQKLFDLRNISYQLLISSNGARLFDKICAHLNKGATNFIDEKSILSSIRQEIGTQSPYSINFTFKNQESHFKNLTNCEIGMEIKPTPKQIIDQVKLSQIPVFPNYSVITLQPKKDPTIVKYDGVMEGNMVFGVSGSMFDGDEQLHVDFVEGSYGFICNYTESI